MKFDFRSLFWGCFALFFRTEKGQLSPCHAAFLVCLFGHAQECARHARAHKTFKCFCFVPLFTVPMFRNLKGLAHFFECLLRVFLLVSLAFFSSFFFFYCLFRPRWDGKSQSGKKSLSLSGKKAPQANAKKTRDQRGTLAAPQCRQGDLSLFFVGAQRSWDYFIRARFSYRISLFLVGLPPEVS